MQKIQLKEVAEDANEAAIAFKKLGDAVRSSTKAVRGFLDNYSVYIEPYNKRTDQKRKIKTSFRRVLGKQR